MVAAVPCSGGGRRESWNYSTTLQQQRQLPVYTQRVSALAINLEHFRKRDNNNSSSDNCTTAVNGAASIFAGVYAFCTALFSFSCFCCCCEGNFLLSRKGMIYSPHINLNKNENCALSSKGLEPVAWFVRSFAVVFGSV